MIYLDNNATTALSSQVLSGMLPYLKERWGNPSARYALGRTSRQAVDEARQKIAVAVGAHPTEVIFTSGGSEANNLLLQGLALCQPGAHLAVGATEHPSVANTARALTRRGHSLTVLPVDDQGRIDKARFHEAARAKPLLMSVLWAHNESGVLQDIPALAAIARAEGTVLHSDSVQAFGKIEVNFRQSGLHAMSISGHKIHGPKGSGALIVDKSLDLDPLIYGGGQERGLRSGTENVAAIVGLGLACEAIVANLERRRQHMHMLHEMLEKGLHQLGAHIFSSQANRLPNTTYFAVPPLDGETMVGQLDRQGYGVASGSACSSSSPKPSASLLAMGVAESLARCAVRVSVSADNTLEEIQGFLDAIAKTKHKLTGLAAVA